jgi:hypothetical protein
MAPGMPWGLQMQVVLQQARTRQPAAPWAESALRAGESPLASSEDRQAVLFGSRPDEGVLGCHNAAAIVKKF